MHRWTREARVSRMLGVFDAGRIINDKAARSQIMGGMIWGVSAALHEGLEIEAERPDRQRRPRRLPAPGERATSPRSTSTSSSTRTRCTTPSAREGIGEIGTVGMAAAVANAIYNATGIRVRHIPITIEDLLA